MRNGQRPRRLRAVEPLESHVMMEPQAGAPPPGSDERPNLVAVPAQDPSDGQVSFDAVDAEDEVQIRISTDALTGEDDLVSEADGEQPSAALIADLEAQPLPYESLPVAPVDDPSLQVRLARIHLRTGSYTLARAGLETLAGRNQLDTAGGLDLAEARWRTGDLQGAGEAASAYLAANGEEVLGFVIAAEAAAMVNRLAEARGYVEQAMQRYLSDLDPVFAGIARKAIWSTFAASPAAVPLPQAAAVVSAPEPAAVIEPAVEQAPEPTVGPAAVGEPAPEPAAAIEPAVEQAPEPAVPVEPAPEPAAAIEPAVEQAPEPTVGPAAVVEPAPEPAAIFEPAPEPAAAIEPAVEQAPEPTVPVEPALELAPEPTVEPAPEPAAANAEAPEDPTVAQADREVAFGRSYLGGNDPLMAALHFGVALRLNQTRASIVIEAIGDRQDAPLQLVRDEAVRLLGMAGDAGAVSQSSVIEPSAPLAEPAPKPAVAVEPEVESEPPAQFQAPEPPPIRWD